MQVVINTCFGGFSVSKAAVEFMRVRNNAHALAVVLAGECYDDGTLNPNTKYDGYECYDDTLGRFNRSDPDLIAAINTLTPQIASGAHANLKVVEIPDNTNYYIHDYDGAETIHEVHKAWS